MIRTFTALALSVAVLLPLTTHATAPSTTPRLIRTQQSPAVYFATADGRRFTFPNERIYRSWYSDFSQVELVSPEALANYRLAGAVVYRPGTLIKLTTDPKVYLVATNGELRWIETEAIARSLFGTTWVQQVHDLSDAFFPAYSVGSSISATSNFSLSALINSESAQAIQTNQGLAATTSTTPSSPSVPTTPIQPTPAPDLILRSSDEAGVRAGDTIRVDAFGSATTPQNIILYVNNLLVKSCTVSASCNYTITHPVSSSLTQYSVRAEAVFTGGRTTTKTLVIPIRDPQAGALRLSFSKTESRPDGPIDIRADWRDPIVPAQKIQIVVDGLEQKVCFNATVCQYSLPMSGSIGTVRSVYLIAEDTSGNRWQTPAQTLTIVANERPLITAGVSSAVIYTGEVIEVNAQASDDDAIREVVIQKDGQTVATCQRALCQYTSPVQTSPGTVSFTIIAKDSQNNQRETTLLPILILPRS